MISTTKPPTIRGHALFREGGPARHPQCALCDKEYVEPSPELRTKAGSGHAKCECGAISAEHTRTGADRKQWHRMHKEVVARDLEKHPKKRPPRVTPRPPKPPQSKIVKPEEPLVGAVELPVLEEIANQLQKEATSLEDRAKRLVRVRTPAARDEAHKLAGKAEGFRVVFKRLADLIITRMK